MASRSDANLEKVKRGCGMIVNFPKGKGEVFHAGSTEWVAGLLGRIAMVERVTRNILDRYLDNRMPGKCMTADTQPTRRKTGVPPVLPVAPAPSARQPCRGHLHLGRARPKGDRRLVRRHGRQYRPFQPQRARRHEAADGQGDLRLSAAFRKRAGRGAGPPAGRATCPRASTRCSSSRAARKRWNRR